MGRHRSKQQRRHSGNRGAALHAASHAGERLQVLKGPAHVGQRVLQFRQTPVLCMRVIRPALLCLHLCVQGTLLIACTGRPKGTPATLFQHRGVMGRNAEVFSPLCSKAWCALLATTIINFPSWFWLASSIPRTAGCSSPTGSHRSPAQGAHSRGPALSGAACGLPGLLRTQCTGIRGSGAAQCALQHAKRVTGPWQPPHCQARPSRLSNCFLLSPMLDVAARPWD